jgi:mRNA interferase RelE/StbE
MTPISFWRAWMPNHSSKLYARSSLRLEGSHFYRADQGEYRVVYDFDPETLYIVVIGKRNDDEVYAKVKRK